MPACRTGLNPRPKRSPASFVRVGADALLLMCNAATHDIAFGLPAPPQGSRRNLAIDTSGVMLPECSPRGRRLVDNSRAHRVQDHFSAILLQGNRHAEEESN